MTLDGINLTLLIGPGSPTACGCRRSRCAGLRGNHERHGSQSGFQIRFHVGPRSRMQTQLLSSEFFDPITTRVDRDGDRARSSLHVLVDGIVTRQEMRPRTSRVSRCSRSPEKT